MIKNLHHLRVLAAIKTQGSVTAAARMLHITQPAVSNILKQLQQTYGYPMVESIGKKLYFTRAGERVLQMAVDIEQLLEQTQSDLDRMHNELSGRLSATIVSTAKYFVPKLLGAFRHQYPKVSVKLHVCNRNDAITALKGNDSDFLIMSQPPKDFPINLSLFYQDELVVAVSPEFSQQPRFQTEALTLTDLADEQWIIREPGSGTRMVMRSLFKQAKIAPNVFMEVSNNESIKQLIIADMGVSLVSKQSIELELHSGLIHVLPVKGFPIKHPWYLVTPRGRQLTAVTESFCQFSKDNMDLIHTT